MRTRLMTAARFLIMILVIMVLFSSCITPGSRQRLAQKTNDPFYVTHRTLDQLINGNKSERSRAAWKLGETGMKRTPEVVPALTGALKDPCPQVRTNAAGALSRIGEDARPAKSALRRVLDDTYGPAVLNAALALRHLKVPDQELIPAVRKVLHDEKGTVRVDAVQLLRAMGVSKQEVIPVLASVLSDPDPKARIKALGVLNSMKLKLMPKKIAVPVIKLLKDSDEEVRWQAALFLGNSYIPIPEARRPLTEALNDSSNMVIGFSARALGIYGKSARNVVPKLIEILNTNPNESTRAKVCEALGQIGSPRKKIAHILVKVLSSDPGSEARYGAVSALRDLKYKDKIVMNALKKASSGDVETSIRTIASITYRQLGGK